jgi:serine phosphatase RsbU (regulator of sigma subunit)
MLVPQGADPVVLAVEEADVILGVVPDFPRREVEADLMPGDTLVLYSDGLVERRGQDFDQGIDQLRRALADGADLPLEELCDHLIDRLVLANHDDDVALVALRLRPPTT